MGGPGGRSRRECSDAQDPRDLGLHALFRAPLLDAAAEPVGATAMDLHQASWSVEGTGSEFRVGLFKRPVVSFSFRCRLLSRDLPPTRLLHGDSPTPRGGSSRRTPTALVCSLSKASLRIFPCRCVVLVKAQVERMRRLLPAGARRRRRKLSRGGAGSFYAHHRLCAIVVVAEGATIEPLIDRKDDFPVLPR